MRKPRKIKRYNKIYRSGYGTRKKVLRWSIFVVIILAVVFVGYSVAGPFMDFVNGRIEPSSSDSSSVDSSQTDSSSSSGLSSESEPEQTADEAIKAVNLPLDTAKDTAALSAFLTSAKENGANAVILELKDTTGVLHYNSSLEQAVSYGAVSSDPLDLSTVLGAIKASGLTPVAKLSAFMDKTAPNVARDNGYLYENTNSAWWDNAVDAGGKPWLNPYKTAACDYLIAIQNELIDAGFETILWHKVEFPEVRQLSSANMGPEAEGVSQQQALSNFISRCETEAETKGATVYISYPVSASFGVNESWFGGDPAALGAKHVAPVMDLSSLSGVTVGEAALDLTDPQAAAAQVLTAYSQKVGEAQILPVVENEAYTDAVKAAAESLEIEGYVAP